MEVSTFELIYKPQAPAAPTGSAAVDRVIQGYFLAITNLEDNEYRYRLEFVISPPPVGIPNQDVRSLAGNTLVFVDTPGTDNQQGILNGTLTSEVFTPSTGFVRVPPRGTALVAVLPSVFGPLPGDPTPIATPTFEVRGFVRISLPALLQFPSMVGGFPFRRVPQSDRPVKVLLTPQNRATFLTASGAISDQTQTGLPLASGQALNEIPPEPGGPIIIGPLVAAKDIPPVAGLMEAMPDSARLGMLAALMAQIDPDRSDLRGFNESLAEADVPLAVERRGAKRGPGAGT